jgi:hypothetical protein
MKVPHLPEPLQNSLSRRQFLLGALALGLATKPVPAGPAPDKDIPLTEIRGKPRDRGRQYGRLFRDQIDGFINREIHKAFDGKPSSKEQMLRYAEACGKEVRRYTPLIHDELEGLAEGSGLRLEELLLLTLHEELYHRGVLPPVSHCTAVAIGPPDTADGRTYVGQTWDWWASMYGHSSMLLWRRDEGPSVLTYAYPGLWVAAGLNEAGLALTWTSAGSFKPKEKIPGPRVGLPTYVLLTHLMYQDSQKAAATEARRLPTAGWFTFVMGDSRGQLMNIEGSPREVAVEELRGQLVRIDFGSRQMTGTPEGKTVAVHPRVTLTRKLLAERQGRLDGPALQDLFGDPKAGICSKGTIDMMVYDCSRRVAWLSRGPSYAPRWQTFTFGKWGRESL